jgi:heme-degrading monooxygenase HmoA
MSCTEMAEIDVRPGEESRFEDAVRAALPLFRRARGYVDASLQRLIERPSTYRLIIVWETLENHTIDFRGSGDFQKWRELAGPYFVSAPRVDHSSTVIRREVT